VTRHIVLATFCIALVTSSCAGGIEETPPALSPRSPGQTPSPTVEPTDLEPPAGEDPAIIVETPQPGDEVSSPVTIAGTADVFEATVSIRILAEDGGEVAATFTTATCGSGCRGRYSTELFFFVEQTQNGVVEVFESSAEDGSPINLVSIPVVLVAG
jgi:hypothetical protein